MANGKAGRPQKEIDWNQFEQLCGLQCTQSEIASFLGVSVDTIYSRSKAQYNDEYSEIYKRFADTGKCSLRRAQFKAAMGGNVSMLIWLGKNLLGQRDSSNEDLAKYSKGIYENITKLANRDERTNSISKAA